MGWSTPILIVAVVLFVALLCMSSEAQGQRERDQLQALRDGFDTQFRAFAVHSANPLFQFTGATATIVKDFEDINQNDDGRIDALRVQRYARNEAGEYFLFMSDGMEKPFFKHVEHRMARFVLKDDYIEAPVR